MDNSSYDMNEETHSNTNKHIIKKINKLNTNINNLFTLVFIVLIFLIFMITDLSKIINTIVIHLNKN